MATTKAKAKPKSAAKRRPAAKITVRGSPKKWSREVTEHSNAMDLQPDVFTLDNPKEIAASLKRSAERSGRRKAEPFQSAMSMLNFYINRAGRNLPEKQRKVLEDAKDELRAAFGRDRQD